MKFPLVVPEMTFEFAEDFSDETEKLVAWRVRLNGGDQKLTCLSTMDLDTYDQWSKLGAGANAIDVHTMVITNLFAEVIKKLLEAKP